MNKIIFFLLFLSVGFTSCQKADDFLDREPISDVTEVLYFTNNQSIVFGLTAVYDVLQWEQAPSEKYSHEWVFGDACSDDAVPGGDNISFAGGLLKLSKFQSGAETVAEVEGIWEKEYAGIARANYMIQKISEVSIDEEEFTQNKARYIAEAKFLRAYFYFELVKIFGGVVLFTEVPAPSEYNKPRSSEQEIWKQIETDLLEASKSLPLKSEYKKDELGRATKGATLSLLAKAYLFQEKWKDAKETAEMVINSNEYDLIDNYQQVFEVEGEHGMGSVFEINYSNQTPSHFPLFVFEGSIIPHNSRYEKDPKNPGWGWNHPTQSLFDAFEANDWRRQATIIANGDMLYDGVTANNGKASYDTGEPTLYFNRKVYIPLKDKNTGGQPETGSPTNTRVIRYSDVLLIHAEASYKADDEGSAKKSLNLVRARARKFSVIKNATLAGDATLLPDVTASGQALLEAIWHERRVELGLEWHRFYDLVRQERAATLLAKYGFKEGTHEHYPIPLIAVQSTEGSVTSNPWK